MIRRAVRDIANWVRFKMIGALLTATLVGIAWNSLLPVSVGWPGARADEVPASAVLFPDSASACFTAGVPPKGRLSPLSGIASLILRPRDPDVDGNGSFPPDVLAKLEPDGPDDIPLTLIVGFDDAGTPDSANARWGARFTCSPVAADEGHYICGVADWCSDVGFELRIESQDRINIDVLPDAGPIGTLGDPCDDSGRLLNGPSNALVSYALDRQPAPMCQ